MRTVEVSTLQELVARVPKRIPLLFIADVGATNTRVSFVPLQLSNAHITFFKAKAGSVPEMIAVFEKTAAAAGKGVVGRVVAAAVAVPGPVTENGGVAVVANFRADNNEGRTIRVGALPHPLCPVGRTQLLNDLHACSAGIAGLNHIGAFSEAFVKMWGPSPPAAAAATKPEDGAAETDASARCTLGKGSVVVLAPGTGLGTALLHYDAPADRYIAVPLEFGHTHIPTYRHGALLASFVQMLGRGNHPAEFDDVCTGRGLEHIYAVAASGNDQLPKKAQVTAPQVSQLAKDGDLTAQTAFRLMYCILMNLASQLSMGFVPHSVVIAGDNAVRHDFFLSQPQNVAALKREFLSHTMERMGFMSRVQVARQTTEMNLNLIGAAFEAAQLVEGGKRESASSQTRSKL
jgi:glucokinase